ncbi:hypothetical protein niasHT_005666 [Heterodera trifolii]|uniref:Uncharacterized protein n=1 Tax=Heterodera trifolii TaxID=157864 RepID=A0ABD2M7Z2_9BILA
MLFSHQEWSKSPCESFYWGIRSVWVRCIFVRSWNCWRLNLSNCEFSNLLTNKLTVACLHTDGCLTLTMTKEDRRLVMPRNEQQKSWEDACSLEELEEELEKEEYGKEAKTEKEEGQTEEKDEHKIEEDKKREEKRTSDSPQQCQQLFDMFADGEEDEEEGAEKMGEPMELDRISVETDAQTVICTEGTDLRPDSSVSSHSNEANSAFAASRTEALRKLLTEPQRFAQPFQRDACSYRSYRAEKGKANDLEYISERHKSDTLREAEPTTAGGGRKALKEVAERAEFEVSAPLRDALETIDAHLAGGANANTKDEQAETEWAYKYCQHEWMKLTIKENANADLVEQFIDALEAFSNRLMEKVVNMTDQNGNTALHYAVSNENFDVVSVLLDSKVCRVDEMNKAGYSALMLGALCELRNETECAIVQRLFQMGNAKHSQTALMLAASHGRMGTTSLLLIVSCGTDVNIQDVDGSTALMCAAEHGQWEIVKILMKRPNVDASLTDCDNQMALSIAVENQHRDIGVMIYAHTNFSGLESNEQSGVSN